MSQKFLSGNINVDLTVQRGFRVQGSQGPNLDRGLDDLFGSCAGSSLLGVKRDGCPHAYSDQLSPLHFLSSALPL